MISVMKPVLFGLYSGFPEGKLKHWMRTASLSIWSALPRRAFVNEGDCVIQVGTPDPEMVRYTMSIVGPKGRVLVMEPVEENFRRICADETIANAENVTIVQRAAWSRREELSFTVSKSKFDGKIAVDDVVHDNDYVEDNYVDSQTVQADTLDNIFEEFDIDHADYVEMHINGAELEALKGMKSSIARVSRIHLKGHAIMSDTGDPINKPIAEHLRQCGFKTKIAARSKARTEAAEAADWSWRAGDVYGARLGQN